MVIWEKSVFDKMKCVCKGFGNGFCLLKLGKSKIGGVIGVEWVIVWVLGVGVREVV